MPGSVRREGDEAVIRLPMEDVHDLRVALSPCTCKATKSNATLAIREDILKRLSDALARLEAGK